MGDRASCRTIRETRCEKHPWRVTPPRLGMAVAAARTDTGRMNECCNRDAYDETFGDRFARRVARRCRRRGLDRTRRRLVDFLSAHGLEGRTVLEIGGGVGEVHLELLRRGARVATNL